MVEAVKIGVIGEHLVGIFMVVEKQQEGAVGTGE